MFSGKLALMALAPVAIAGATAATAFLIASRCCAQSKSKGDDGAAGDERSEVEPTDHDYVRPAGPKEMENPPKEGWSEVDEASDESFPASDPPARY